MNQETKETRIIKPHESYCGTYASPYYCVNDKKIEQKCYYIDIENEDSIKRSIYHIFKNASEYWVNSFIMSRLERICRFAGCVKFYSVEDHSRQVEDIASLLMEKSEQRDSIRRDPRFVKFAQTINCPGILTLEIPEDQQYKISAVALYHDMPEIFIGDIPSPVKNLSKEIKELENLILKYFYEARGLLASYFVGREFIKAADLIALGLEKKMIGCDDHWSMVEGVGLTRELLELIENNICEF